MSKKLFLNTQSSRIPVEKLISYLRLNNDIIDQTGNLTYSKVGTIFSNGIFSGVANESIQFTSLSDRLNTPDTSSLTFLNKPFSLSLCVNITNIGVNQNGILIRYLISKRGDVSNREWQLDIRDTGKLMFRIYDNSTGGYIECIGNTILSNSTPYHIVCSYDGGAIASGLKIFLNGVLETMTFTNSGAFVSMENLSEKISIGGVDWSSANSVSPLGKFDGIGFWNVKLNKKQVKSLYDLQSAGYEVI